MEFEEFPVTASNYALKSKVTKNGLKMRNKGDEPFGLSPSFFMP